jgi:hypothetical protein
MKIFPVPAVPGLSGTGTGTCLSPTMTRRRQRDIETPSSGWDGVVGCQSVGLVAGQHCMSRTLAVIGSFSRKPGTLHVARCTLHVAGSTMLVTRYLPLTRCLWDGWASRPATQSVRRVQGLQAQNHPEGEMQLHVLHHMDDRGSHEVMVIIDQ